jgi:large subunit ribosomal protein L1
VRAKPPTSKGVYMRSITLSATMSPGIAIDPLDAATGAGVG